MKGLLTIIVPAPHAGLLEIGEECASLGPAGYVVENVGPEFADSNGWQVVEVTLLERTKYGSRFPRRSQPV